MKLDLLLADGEISVIQFFGNGIEPIAEVEVDKGNGKAKLCLATRRTS